MALPKPKEEKGDVFANKHLQENFKEEIFYHSECTCHGKWDDDEAMMATREEVEITTKTCGGKVDEGTSSKKSFVLKK